MIVNFSVGNWMSFRDPAELSLLATSERQHGERVPRSKGLQKRVVPIAAIYGGNASGKTNLFQALNAMQDLVVEGTKIDAPIRVEPFRLDGQRDPTPTAFAIEVLIDDKIWQYQFSCTRKCIVSESLRVFSRSSERVLFERQDGVITPGADAVSERSFLEFAAKGTRDNQLYLTNTVSQKIDDFKPIYDWFRKGLILVAPDARFGAFDKLVDRDGPFHGPISESLRRLDTGITELGCEPVDLEALGIPRSFMEDLQGSLSDHNAVRFFHPKTDDRIIVRRNKAGDIEAQRLITYHKNAQGEKVRFDIQHESDGSQRAIDLLPAFFSLSEGAPITYVIDELDRSLHTQLTRSLITHFLESCHADSRSQLLLTTHDVQLMEQNLFRRDEMWLVERDAHGASQLVPFSDFNKDNRYDKDIRKAYLQGRMGGVPRILPWRSEAVTPLEGRQ
ncbi:MAG: ATP-binding protein [Planctomycetota bacterium]|nr:MAG: ATP-binding protein [Planctomycetota bacterium]